MNKTLLKSVREYKKQSVMAPLLVVLEVFMEVLIPLEMAKIIDVGIAQGDMNYIIQRGVILVVMAMLALFFGVQAGNMAAVAGAGYAKNLRHDIFYKIQEFSFHNIDHFSTSGLVTRMTTDITNVQMAYMMSIRLLARAPIMVILSWVMTLLLNKKAALLFLIVVPVLGGTLIFIAKKAHPHFIKVFDEYDVLNNSVQENVNASRVVKAFVREDYEVKKFHGISQYVYNLFTKAEKIALGDPESVPVGQYAKEAFENLGMWDDVEAKTSFGTNVTEVLSWVAAGSADAGIVYLTDATTSDQFDQVKVIGYAPEGSVSKVIYPVGVVSASTKKDAAQKFVDYLGTDDALSFFAEYGFTANK